MSRLGWQSRLLLLIPFVLGGLLLFQVLYALPYAREQAVRMDLETQEAIARNMAWAMDAEMVGTRDRLAEIAARPEFVGMDSVLQQQTLEAFAMGSERFGSMAVIDAVGRVVSVAGVPADVCPLDDHCYAGASCFDIPFLRGEVFFGEPQVCEAEHLTYLTVGVPIEAVGQRVGVLLATLRLDRLIEMVTSYPLEAGMIASAVDGKGVVVARTGVDMFSLDGGPRSLDSGHWPLPEGVDAGQAALIPEHSHDGVPYRGRLAVVESTGWCATVERPTSLTLAEANALSSRLLPVNGIGVAIVLLIAVILGWRIVKSQARLERSLSDSEAKYRALFEQSADAIYICDPHDSVIDANPAWLNLFGYSRDELKGFNASGLYVDPQDREDFLRRMAATGFVEDEVRFKKKDGTEMDCIRNAVAWKDRHGNVVACQTSVRDVTERKRVEARIVEANRELRELAARLETAREEERAEVAWELHDEVSQALSVLSVDLDTCRRKLPAESLISVAPTIDGMAQVLDQTVGRLRRLYEGLAPVMLEDLGLAATIEWQALEFACLSGIECEPRRVEDIKLPHGRVTLGLFRVLQEALGNVLRHSGATKVTVDFERVGNDAVLRVSDNGHGFTDEEGRKPGAIGLTSMRERVLSWDGRMTVTSSIGAGTVIEVTAPLDVAPAGKGVASSG